MSLNYAIYVKQAKTLVERHLSVGPNEPYFRLHPGQKNAIIDCLAAALAYNENRTFKFNLFNPYENTDIVNQIKDKSPGNRNTLAGIMMISDARSRYDEFGLLKKLQSWIVDNALYDNTLKAEFTVKPNLYLYCPLQSQKQNANDPFKVAMAENRNRNRNKLRIG
jgi:hypothetical protein